MHDPHTEAFVIRSPFKTKGQFAYHPALLTIWHKDPETDGTDDSCGWWIRLRHVDEAVVTKVQKEFEFNFKNNYWFEKSGAPVFSVIGTVLNMYSTAAWTIFMHQNNDKPNRRRHRRFMRKHLFEILHTAENPTDSLFGSVTMKYGPVEEKQRIRDFVAVVVSDIYNMERKWYQKPKWHIHHWSIQFNLWQNFRRRLFDKCSICGKRGFKGAAIGDGSGKIWHDECDERRG